MNKLSLWRQAGSRSRIWVETVSRIGRDFSPTVVPTSRSVWALRFIDRPTLVGDIYHNTNRSVFVTAREIMLCPVANHQLVVVMLDEPRGDHHWPGVLQALAGWQARQEIAGLAAP
jgi:hypothetical protein